jgi:hypothetical protein
MVGGFWTHPDFTLATARYGFQWALRWDAPHITLIENAASDHYQHYRLYAVWWHDVSVLAKTEPNIPFAIPGGFTEFCFRSYQPVNQMYSVRWIGTPQLHTSEFPCGTIVYVRQ